MLLLVPGHEENGAGNTQSNNEGALLMDSIPLHPVATVQQGVVVMDGANIAWGWGITYPNLLGRYSEGLGLIRITQLP